MNIPVEYLAPGIATGNAMVWVPAPTHGFESRWGCSVRCRETSETGNHDNCDSGGGPYGNRGVDASRRSITALIASARSADLRRSSKQVLRRRRGIGRPGYTAGGNRKRGRERFDHPHDVPLAHDGRQAQFIERPLPAFHPSDLFADTIAWVQEHLDELVTVEGLAGRSAMSPRTFARRFRAETGTTPYQWLLRQRVHQAQRLLEMTDLSIEAVAERSGLCTAANLRKHFSRMVHNSPQAYRLTFKNRITA